jgi:phosphoribosylaminoimidazole-succinocarboxamide synthase
MISDAKKNKREDATIDREFPGKSLVTAQGEIIEKREAITLYHSGKPNLIIQQFHDSEKSGPKKNTDDLSRLRNEISSYLFEYVEGYHIPTHFVSRLSPTAMVVKKLEPLPLTVRIYNAVGDALTKRYGLKEGALLDFPVTEHFYTGGRRPPVMVNEYHMFAFNITTPEEIKQINRISSKVNAVLRGLCDRRQLYIADLQLGFGKLGDQIILADELSPFTCHFWDLSASGKRDRYLPDHEKAVEAFTELNQRLRVRV